MADKKCVGILEVKLKGEVYSRRYAMKDVEMVVKLVNDMFENEINIEIIEVLEKKLTENRR